MSHHTQHCSQKPHTFRPARPNLLREDAEDLWKTLNSNKTDNNIIIAILAKRTLAERTEIIKYYKEQHDSNLVDDLKKKLSGDLKDLIIAMMTPLDQFYAMELHRAVDGWGTNESILIEVLCTLRNYHIRDIKQYYRQLYKVNLEDDIKDDTSGNFRDLLVALIKTERHENAPVDQQDAINDAETLSKAAKNDRWKIFSDILIHRSFAQLQLIFNEFKKLTDKPIESSIKDYFSGDVEDAFLAIVSAVQNKAKFFAQKLRDSMKGLGTRDHDLIRLIVTRSAIDIEDIQKEYETLYSESLKNAIIDDTSGDYKKCLLLLFGEGE